jgi:putative glutamine amidotransferase
MKIGLTKTRNLKKHQYYIDWLKGDEKIEIVTLSVDDDNLDEINNCDALVLSGGVDVHPKFYGSKTGYPGEPEEFNEKRDEFEIAAFHSAEENNIPILGICRGMQLINVIHKGTLIQHLEDESLIEVHKGNPDKSHVVTVEKNTILYDITGTGKSEINSAHHQVIDKLGEGLVINARSDEGLVEGIEREDKSGKPFLLAIQWHPERMFRFQLENSPASKAIRERFIQEIEKSIANKNEDH